MILKLESTLTLKNAQAVGRAGLVQLSQQEELSVDCSELTQVDSSALAVFVSWQREADCQGKRLQLNAVPLDLQNLAKIYGVDQLLAFN